MLFYLKSTTVYAPRIWEDIGEVKAKITGCWEWSSGQTQSKKCLGKWSMIDNFDWVYSSGRRAFC